MAKARYKRRKVNGRSIDEHRLVMEQQLGRQLTSIEYVHHGNENRFDNRPDNLEVMDPCAHGRLHHLRYPIKKNCVVCGTEFEPHKTKRKRKKTCSENCRQILSAQKRITVTKEQYEQIRLRRLNGEKLSALASEFSVAEATICEWSKHGCVAYGSRAPAGGKSNQGLNEAI